MSVCLKYVDVLHFCRVFNVQTSISICRDGASFGIVFLAKIVAKPYWIQPKSIFSIDFVKIFPTNTFSILNPLTIGLFGRRPDHKKTFG
jgi:hypothetical protein